MEEFNVIYSKWNLIMMYPSPSTLATCMIIFLSSCSENLVPLSLNSWIRFCRLPPSQYSFWMYTYTQTYIYKNWITKAEGDKVKNCPTWLSLFDNTLESHFAKCLNAIKIAVKIIHFWSLNFPSFIIILIKELW